MQTRYDLGINFILDTKQIRIHTICFVLWMSESELSFKMVCVHNNTVQKSYIKYIYIYIYICHLILFTVQHLWIVKYTVGMNEKIQRFFPLTALSFQFVMKEKVSVYVEPLYI
jgi:hypothetical protein